MESPYKVGDILLWKYDAYLDFLKASAGMYSPHNTYIVIAVDEHLSYIDNLFDAADESGRRYYRNVLLLSAQEDKKLIVWQDYFFKPASYKIIKRVE